MEGQENRFLPFQRRRRKFWEFWSSRSQISSFFSAAGAEKQQY